MITRKTIITDDVDFKNASGLICRLASSFDVSLTPDDLLFFDIETTGLSADSSYLYLIGCMYLENGEVVLEQFFSEGIREEELLIHAYDSLLSVHPVPVHFNGSTFDLPYIEKKRRLLGIEPPVRDGDGTGFDIYRSLHPFKAFLGTGSMSQKSLERYCGLQREDVYDGGELIVFYNRYIAARRLESLRERTSASGESYIPGADTGLTRAGTETSAQLLETLLLHNYEDVLNMPVIARLLALPALVSGSYSIENASPAENGLLTLRLRPDFTQLMEAFHRPHFCQCHQDSTIRADFAEGLCTFEIPVEELELKLFYPDYRNYYYLPAEDSIVPKTIGDFMDKSLRERCKAENCCTKHTLRFIPLPGELSKKETIPFKVFKRYYSDRYAYVDLAEIMSTPEYMNMYASRLVKSMK